MNKEDVNSILESTDLIRVIEPDIVRKTVDAVCRWVLMECSSYRNKKVLLVPILDGALPLFGSICRILDENDVCYDYQSVWIDSYRSDSTKGVLNFYKMLRGCWKNYLVILIDDIYDTGDCAKGLVNYIVSDRDLDIDIIDIRFVFLVTKKKRLNMWVKGKRIFVYAPLCLDDCTDGFVVGCGMDCHYYCRGLKSMMVYGKSELISNLRKVECNGCH